MFRKIKNKNIKLSLTIVAVFFIVAVLFGLSYFIFTKVYQNKIYPRVTLGEINLGGLTPEEADEILVEKLRQINENGIEFVYKNKKIAITPTVASFEVDLAREVMIFNPHQTVDRAMAVGRESNFFSNLENIVKTLIFKQQIALASLVNKEEIKEVLQGEFKEFDLPGQSARLTATSTIVNGNQEKIVFNIAKEELGKVIDYDKALSQLETNIKNLNTADIALTSKSDYPKIYKNETLNIEVQAQKIVTLAPLTLDYKLKKWTIEAKVLANWLALKRSEDNKIVVGLDSEITSAYLEESIAKEIDREPIDAKFEVKNGRVIKFQGSRDGLKLNLEENIKKLEAEIIDNQVAQIELIVDDLKSSVETGDANDMGIKEIIGTGHSNFAGSPQNRRHNIATGAAAINGLIIKPDEEFSLLNALGEVNAESGYLQELVIKGNKTIPEYGGGLCQIGTTLFRAITQSGLPVTARRNHSYRVSYYEPAGTDATIYNPWPDVKFLNDTGKNILIQTRIEGDDIYFDFWGQKDGRIVEVADPVIYNITKPPPTKIIETLDLAPGEKKCTERAHNGADAYFDYKVTYPVFTATSTPVVKEKRFSSHYVPWQEVCLIGVEELSEDAEENKADNETATSTE